MGGLDGEIRCLGRWFFSCAGAHTSSTDPQLFELFEPDWVVLEPHPKDLLPVTRV